MKTRVVIADDHPAFTLGMRLALQDAGLDVVGVAADGDAAVRVAAEHRPDVVVLDVRMPGMNGIDACRAIMQAESATAVVILSTYDDAATKRGALEAGARAFLTKETPVRSIADVVSRLHREPRLSLIDAPALPSFTRRESQVLGALVQGLSNKDIARSLGISVETVKDHCSAVFGKLHATDRVQAVIAARRLGLGQDS
jgi:two-component system, NarL family, nitrate/nitrite response regulator NarL